MFEIVWWMRSAQTAKRETSFLDREGTLRLAERRFKDNPDIIHIRVYQLVPVQAWERD